MRRLTQLSTNQTAVETISRPVTDHKQASQDHTGQPCSGQNGNSAPRVGGTMAEEQQRSGDGAKGPEGPGCSSPGRPPALVPGCSSPGWRRLLLLVPPRMLLSRAPACHLSLDVSVQGAVALAAWSAPDDPVRGVLCPGPEQAAGGAAPRSGASRDKRRKTPRIGSSRAKQKGDTTGPRTGSPGKSGQTPRAPSSGAEQAGGTPAPRTGPEATQSTTPGRNTEAGQRMRPRRCRAAKMRRGLGEAEKQSREKGRAEAEKRR